MSVLEMAFVLAWPFSVGVSAWTPADGVRAVLVAEGLRAPVFVTSPASDRRLFVVEQPGRIRIIQDGRILPVPFLDLGLRVTYGGERGLLGLAFHPNFARNGFFFVNFTDSVGDTRIERFHADPAGGRAEPGSGRLVVRIAQPYANHNGGMLAFGPDGMLYVGTGDGGSGGDPHGNGQNPQALLGKLLRLDVDSAMPYAIPPGNPYAHRAGARPEIWASGLRNPWRFSFDRATGRLFVGDVGQNRWEEIDIADARTAGLNYGWNIREGLHPFGAPRPSPDHALEPVAEYGHDEGCSVTGGCVYRGRAMAGLQGTYFFSDYCKGWLRSFRFDGLRVIEKHQWNIRSMGSVSSFGEGGDGELYVTSLEGRLYRLESAR